MKATWTRHLAIASLFALVGCTQGVEPEYVIRRTQTLPSDADVVAEFQFAGGTTQTLQMTQTGGALYMTGKPFGFMKADIASDAENPYLAFAMSDDIEAFSQIGKWVVDWYASGAVAVTNGLAILSGTAGASVINISSLQFPNEIFRYPTPTDPNGTVPRDERFVYKGIATNPTAPFAYGFRQQDLGYTLKINSNGSLTPVAQTTYGQPGQSVCCAMGAAWYSNKVFVAMRSRLWVFDVNMDTSSQQYGWLITRKELMDLQSVNVQASQRFVYIQHEPTSSIPGSTSNSAGIYVYDAQGRNVKKLPYSPLAFAVSPDDRYIYANMDDERIVIIKINWTN